MLWHIIANNNCDFVSYTCVDVEKGFDTVDMSPWAISSASFTTFLWQI
jgi:hypothetical protein